DGLPTIKLEKSATGLIASLAVGGPAKSKSDARTYMQSRAGSANGIKAESLSHAIDDSERLFGQYSLLKHGKKLDALVDWQ
ncbi:tyrosine--tRNA ligase, partial [Pseudomonas sp. MWU12-2534b]